MKAFLILMACLFFNSLSASDCLEWRLELLENHKRQLQEELISIIYFYDYRYFQYLSGKIDGIDIAISFITSDYEE